MGCFELYSTGEEFLETEFRSFKAYHSKWAREVCARNQVPVCDCYAKWKKLEENGADVTRLLANRVNHPAENLHWLCAVSRFEMILGM